MSQPGNTKCWVNSICLFWILRWALTHSKSLPSQATSLVYWSKSDIERAYQNLKQSWNTQLSEKSPSFIRALLHTFGGISLRLGTLALPGVGFQIVQAILLGYFVEWIASEESEFLTGLLIWLAFVLSVFTASVCLNACLNLTSIELIQVKNVIVRCILDKVPKLAYQSMREHSVSALVMNLIGSDFEFLEKAQSLTGVWAYFSLFIVAASLLINLLGVAGLVGLGLLVLHFGISFLLVTVMAKTTARTAEVSDHRVELTVKLVEGIKLLKLYAWETKFLELIGYQRSMESKELVKTDLVIVTLRTLMTGLSVLLFFVPIYVYIKIHGEITLSTAYVGIALLFICNMIVFFMLVAWLGNFVQLLTACSRVTAFLLMPETDRIESSGQTLDLEHACFGWNTDSIHSTVERTLLLEEKRNIILSDISLTIHPGQLCVVTGPVASGKSALLLGLLQEMPLRSGLYSPAGTLAYSGDTPWVIPATLKENITIGKPFNKVQYYRALRISNLDHDLTSMPDADDTLVGDRGITLSGGQKARLNLARAIYADSDFLLLDDPLSAVDTEVGNRVLQGLLELANEGKGIVLATHNSAALQVAHQVLVLIEGTQHFCGTYQEMTEIGYEGNVLPEVTQSTQISTNRQIPEADFNEDEPDEATDPASFGTYYKYLRLGFKNGCVLSLVVLVALASQVSIVAFYYWTALWLGAEEQDDSYYLGSFCYLLAAVYILMFLRAFALYVTVTKANDQLIQRALTGLARTALMFYDSSPAGRILNRFTKDVALIDVQILNSLCDALNSAIHICGSMIVAGIVLPMALVGLFLFFAVIIMVTKKFILFNTRLREFEIQSKTPLLSVAHSLLTGILEARSMGLCDNLVEQGFEASQNCCNAETSTSYMYGYIVLLTDVASCLVSVFAATFLLIISGDADPALAGTALLLLITLSSMSAYSTSSFLRAHACMNSVQRLFRYSQLPPEGRLDSDRPFKITEGQINFTNVYMRYQPHLPYALIGFSLFIPAGSKVGIIGRTGAGKSSLIHTLFRLRNPSHGSIYIDNQDIVSVGLHQLRSQMSVIPQDALIFKDTLAKNIDPTGQATREELMAVINQVQLTSLVDQQARSLERMISSEETILSAGQKQLICLARALLRKSKVVVLDEPTSSVDHQTDEIVQKIIKQAFHESTVLTIAHRLRSVIDADLVVVVDKGQCQESGSPRELASVKSSLFAGFIEQAGQAEANYLHSALAYQS